VGVNKYQHAAMNQPEPLKYAEADVQDLADLLKASGYDVDLLVGRQATQQAIDKKLKLITEKGESDGAVLVALAGHGVQFEKDEDAYYCPYDTKIREAVRDGMKVLDRNGLPILEPTPESCVPLTDIVDLFRLAPAGTRILLADCCRNDPTTGRGRGVGSGIERNRLPPNTAVLLSCSKDQRAFEDDRWKHGAFFYHVLEGLRSNKKNAFALTDYLLEAVPAAVAALRDAPRQDPYALLNGRRLDFGIRLSVAIAPFTATEARLYQQRAAEDLGQPVLITNSIGMKLKLIPAGEFLMGSPGYEESRDDDEGPQHRVRITKAFYLGTTEVTKGQFAAFVRDTGYRTEAERDGKGGGGYNAAKHEFGRDPKYSWRYTGFPYEDDHPVVNVTWNDAVAFCEWLSRKEGRTYRLPTEAEWEYACRAGTTTAYYHGNDAEGLADVGNVADLTAKEKFSDWTTISRRDGYVFTAPVGRFRPNGFGLYDMHGNVWEWCEDWYARDFYKTSAAGEPDPVNRVGASDRVIRGGSWINYPRFCRSAYRYNDAPDYRNHNLGFRVAAVPSSR
jgi:formylglycine-generating enzyme required for sulfatase activity